MRSFSVFLDKKNKSTTIPWEGGKNIHVLRGLFVFYILLKQLNDIIILGIRIITRVFWFF